MKNQESPLHRMIHRLRVEADAGDLTLGEIHEIFAESGHFILILGMCLPFLQPVPLPGLSTPLGLLICLSGLFQYFKKEPWIPRRWMNRKVQGEVIRKILEVSEKISERVLRWVYPRWSFWVDSESARLLNGGVIVINGFLLALPLPIPFTNTAPAVVLTIQAIGNLEQDGALVVGSYALTMLCVAFFLAIAFGVRLGLGIS